MTDAVSAERWGAAQKAEREFWRGVPSDSAAVARLITSGSELALWASSNLPEMSPDAPCAEFGIGPLGIGCAHFLQTESTREIVGVDPLALVPPSALALPYPLVATIHACRDRHYRHVTAVGESTGLESGSFGLVILNNMLDHVQDPKAVLSEAHRILRPGGFVLVGCDVFSVLGRFKFAVYTRRRMPDSILVRAHPFRFRGADLKGLLRQSGFAVLATKGGDASWLAGVAGRAGRMYLLAQRPS
jgi:SAM-dependent methyltransferase